MHSCQLGVKLPRPKNGGCSVGTFFRLVLLLIAACLFGAGISLGYRDFVGAETACFMAGVSVLLFVFLSQFKRFKGPFGIEGEMWEREMEEAHEITERYRNLATVIAKPLIANSVRMGRWSSGLSRREVDKMVSEVKTILENSGSRPEEIEAVLEDYRHYTAFDLSRSAYTAVKSVLDAKVKEKREAVEAFKGRIKADEHEAYNTAAERLRAAEESAKGVMKGFDISNADSFPETIKSRVNECSLLDETEKSDLLSSVQDTFDDLTHFGATGKIRRPDVWFVESEE